MRSEDGYIIQKCLDGEKEAFGFLVDKYLGFVKISAKIDDKANNHAG